MNRDEIAKRFEDLNLPPVLMESPDDTVAQRYYTIRFCCGNCTEHGWIYVLKGVALKGRIIKCPNCECNQML